MNADLRSRVVKVVSEVTNLPEKDISLAASLKEELKMDSLQRMTLFIALEDEFQNDSMPPEEVAGLVTVADIVRFVEAKLLAQSPPA
jgi:acyl carrier protein